MSTTNIQEFSRDWAKIAEEVEVLPGQLLKKVSSDLHADIMRRTPVKTGRARANWFRTVGQPSEEVLPPGDYGEPTIDENIQIDGKEPVYIVNNLPYIDALENGHSQKAPFGMVALALENLDAQLSERLHEL